MPLSLKPTHVMLSPSVRQRRARPLAIWVGGSLLLMGLALLLDGPVAQALDIHSSAFLQDFARWMTLLGEGWVVALGGVLIALVLIILGRHKAARMVYVIAVIGLLTGAAATLLRSVVGRTRPNAHAAQGFYGIRYDSHWIIGKYEFGSFPSGHAATVVGLAAAAWSLNRRLGMVAAIYALLVSWSRIAQGSHHFSDIVAAAILGVAGAHFVLTRAGPLVRWVDKGRQEACFWARPRVSEPRTDVSSRV